MTKQLSIEQARELYALGGKAAEIAVELFPELRERKLPKTWEEYGTDKFDLLSQCYVAKSQLQAFSALSKLYLLKQEYNGDWVADWNNDNDSKHIIRFSYGHMQSDRAYNVQFFLAFKTAELRDEFAANFKELIEAAKPLLG